MEAVTQIDLLRSVTRKGHDDVSDRVVRDVFVILRKIEMVQDIGRGVEELPPVH